MEGGFYASP